MRDERRPRRPMNAIELKVARILRSRYGHLDHFANEEPFIPFEDVAVEIVRELAADAASKILAG